MGSNNTLAVVLSGLVLGLLERTKALVVEHGLTVVHDMEKRPIIIVHPSGTEEKLDMDFFVNFAVMKEHGLDPWQTNLVLSFHTHTLPAEFEDSCFLSPQDLQFGIQHTLFERVVSVARGKKLAGEDLNFDQLTLDGLAPMMLAATCAEVHFSTGQDRPLFLVGDLRHDFFQFSFPSSSSELGNLREREGVVADELKEVLNQMGIKPLPVSMSSDDLVKVLFYMVRHSIPDTILPPQRQFFRSAGQQQAEVETMLEKLLEPFGLQGEPIIIQPPAE